MTSVMVWSLLSRVLLVSSITTRISPTASTVLSPWDEFYEYVVTTQNETCSPDRLCFFNGTKFNRDCNLCPPCQCDSQCKLYGDCCPDVALTDVIEESTHQPYRCQSNTFKVARNHNSKKHFFVYDVCSDVTNRTLVNLCNNPDQSNIRMNIPVTSSSGEVYRNRFCAICNGNYNFRFWNIRSECSEIVTVPRDISKESMIALLMTHSKCSISYSPATGTRVRECHGSSDDLVQTCNVTGSWNVYDKNTEMACARFLNPLKQGGLLFKNIFCMYCNVMMHYKPYVNCKFDTPFPFSVIIDPTTSQKIQQKLNIEDPCNYREVLDTFQGTCRQIFCSEKRILDTINKKCKSIFESAKGMAYELKLSLTTHETYEIAPNDIQWLSNMGFQFRDVFEEKLQTSAIYYDTFAIQLSMKLSETVLSEIILHTKFIVLSEILLELLETRLINMLNSDWIFPLAQLNMTSSPAMIVMDKKSHTNEDVVNMRLNLVIRPKSILPYVEQKPYIYAMVSRTLVCPFVYYNESEYHVHKSVLTLSASNTSVARDLFVLKENNTVIICLDAITESQPNVKHVSPNDIFSTAFIIVSLACQGVSLACLLVTLFIFCLFSSLRTVPGKNSMGLISTLICALTLQTFGIARVELHIVCRVIGISFHFFLLSSFCWMSICTVHMFRVFRHMLGSRITRSHENKQFICYVILSLVIPGTVIAATIIVNLLLTDGKDLGYGKGICYISNFYSIIGGLLIPVTVVVLLNIVLFISTIITLRGVASDSDLIGKRNYLSVYVKMSTLTGINWMSAFIAAATSSQVMWYIFTVMCALQGVYIFISFVCNRRVFILLRTMCGRKTAESKETSNKPLSSPPPQHHRDQTQESSLASLSPQHHRNQTQESSLSSPSPQQNRNQTQESSLSSPSPQQNRNQTQESSLSSPSPHQHRNQTQESSLSSPSPQQNRNQTQESSLSSPSPHQHRNQTQESYVPVSSPSNLTRDLKYYKETESSFL